MDNYKRWLTIWKKSANNGGPLTPSVSKIIDRIQKYKTSDCNLNLRVHMFMKGAFKTQ